MIFPAQNIDVRQHRDEIDGIVRQIKQDPSNNDLKTDLYNLTVRYIYGICYLYADGNKDDAEDFTSQTFVKIFENIYDGK